MLKRILGIMICALLLGGYTDTSHASSLAEPKDEYVIVIDPGHGGSNCGTTSNENFMEKEITLKTAKGLVDELSKYDGVKVIMTRSGDEELSLKERAVYAKEVGADYLFSLHYNASENHTMFGTEVWIPLYSPYHAPCYQFAYLHQLQMQELGLFSRGIKTRINEQGTDYYGVIRESVALGVPAVIIEHCYVDESRDIGYCDEDADYVEFGKRDAIAIAQFLGLESVEEDVSIWNMTAQDIVAGTYEDRTKPDSCDIVAEYMDRENKLLTLTVKASDKDSAIMYYDYTTDGGVTFSKLYPWPQSNMLTGEYDKEFSLILELDEAKAHMVYVRAYNKFDLYKESNVLSNFKSIADKPQNLTESKEPSSLEGEGTTKTEGVVQEGTKQDTSNYQEYVPVLSEKENNQSVRSVILCLFVVIWTVLLIAMGVVVYRFFVKRK